MAKKTQTKKNKAIKAQKDNALVKMTSFFFQKWRLTMLLWVFILGFGATTYTTLIKREGFPPIQFPVSFVNGFYLGKDKNSVDIELAQPFYEAVKDVEGVDKVITTANDNSFTGVIYFEEGVVPQQGAAEIERVISQTQSIPAEAQLSVISIDPAAYLNKYDLLVSVYSSDGQSTESLQDVGDMLAKELTKDPVITTAEVQYLLTDSDENSTEQTSFNQIGLPTDGRLRFYPALTIGVDRDSENYDALALSDAVQQKINEFKKDSLPESYNVVIGADFAETIKTQISSLESNLLTGLLAVAIVSLLLITWRASIITGLFMLTVMAMTIALLYLFGYSLNTITLFALVLSLGLFVDDATIVVESIDAAKSKNKNPREVVKEAVTKIAAASFAGTFTTVLVFLPLVFISGILGEFIRLMPITVIIALLSSLVLSLTLIPVLSKYILLRNQMPSWFTRVNPVAKTEEWLGHRLGQFPKMLASREKKSKFLATGLGLLSVIAIFISFQLAGLVPFNIFPASKDSDQIGVTLQFPENYSITQAEQTAYVADEIVATVVKDLGRRVTYGSFSFVQPNSRSADMLIELVPFTDREKTSPEIISELTTALADLPNDTKVRVSQYDQGPPSDDYPMKIQIYSNDVAKKSALANDVQEFLKGKQIEKVAIPSIFTTTEYFEVKEIAQRSQNQVARVNGDTYAEVSGRYDGADTSALLQNTKTVLEEKFTSEYLQANGYDADAITYDFGQESENEESFAALGLIFPLALVLMYILLALQFKSLLQPLLIFMAIPFTFLGVFGGLLLTDNSLSFFVMIGLVGLIGIAVNNTILLTTYANQERSLGQNPIDAIANAITKRFRPLLATTLTTVVALLPLALSDPFWEPLAFTIIFGLISSTVLVVLSFPYYYLAAEWLRMRVSRGTRKVRLNKKTS